MIPALITIALVAGLLGCLFIAERRLPLRTARASLLTRLFINLCFSAAAFATAAILVRPFASAAMAWAGTREFGLVHAIPLPAPVRFVLAFLCMDLTFYWWHVLNHRLPLLWRFHNVHHMDPDLDVSTGFRFHFGEVALSALFRVVQVAGIGISLPAFATYELVFQANTLFHHSNVRLPIRLERVLNKVFVTPRMHGIHHSQIEGEANSNYSVVFSWWDRLHRTLGLNVPQSEIVTGVPGYSLPRDNTLGNLLTLPFRKQRAYWTTEDGRPATRTLTGDPTRMAE